MSKNVNELLQARIRSARKGAKIYYHTGALLGDREKGAPDFLRIDGLAQVAWDAYKAGKVTLVQHTTAPGVHEYIAVKK
jgi:hypothetical protein